ncbi:Acyl-CoA synthetase (NDP forming) [Quadrisphaera granulorum]|uniref:Acyl-CoA synthetase (NDP forming) n=1 Tax=Quadrisphaera granulorum TaxID=317664 RepID=A0A316AHC7_9ACTN|nr:acyl-CoA synthetase (NDP forming) [Quadrisphaera granulorum]SZE98194.1 Acyl-CoA synthetase (NDP forming) [Quadrisphaera granulorum]
MWARAWEADVVLRDGGAAHIRPIQPHDADALQAFHVAQSPRSTYLRFFAPMPRLSPRDLTRFTTVDHHDRVALVVLVGDAIIGVGRYDRVEEGVAEVAFNVSDAHQGRGVGSVLLEHLVVAAREQGITRFVAEVLPENRKMLDVFTEAGFATTRAVEDGVVMLTVDIAPTDRSREVMEAREHRAESESLRRLLHPRSVVVVGAGRRPGSVGGRLLADLVGGGFTGDVHVVHPEADVVRGVPAVRSLADVPGPVDLAVVAVPAESVNEVVEGLAELDVRGLVVVSSGFAEVDEAGLARQRELLRLARGHGMRLVGPTSFGIINTDPQVRLNASLAPVVPPPGGLGLFSQSGALGITVLDAANRRGLGISTFVSAGNRADVSGNDCMQYWQDDPATTVVGLYLESVGNPRKFSRVARGLARTKPVVVVKSGVSSFTVPPGHAVRETRAPREALDAMLRQAGVIRVDNVHQLFDVAQLLKTQPLPAGERIGVVANSGALAALAAEAAVSWGLDVADPAVVAPEAEASEVREALQRVFSDPDVDAVVACLIPPVTEVDREVVAALQEVAADAGKPCAACLVALVGGAERTLSLSRVEPGETSDDEPAAGAAGTATGDATAAGESGGDKDDDGDVHGGAASGALPVYSTPEDAVRSLAAVVRYAAWRRRDPGTRVDPAGTDARAARSLVESLLSGRTADDPPLQLEQEEVSALLACYGVQLWPSITVRSADEAVRAADRVGWPVAVKATERRLRHPGLGGVRLDVADARELRAHVTSMLAGPAGSGGGSTPALLVQAMASAGISVLVRTLEDPLFGPLVSFGLAGDTTVLLGDVSHRIPPLTDVDVVDLVRTLRAAPRLFGYMGTPAVDVHALEDLLARISVMADDLPEVFSSELSPVQVAERGLAVLGAQVELAVPVGRADAGRRVLPQ